MEWERKDRGNRESMDKEHVAEHTTQSTESIENRQSRGE
jgi:hypothetical protein